ncbi:ChrR family anti-sigma-E factor [Roseivivax sp.]
MISHHLPDDLLMAYSAGALPEAFELAVATHLSLCPDCRAGAESYDHVGGALLEDAEEAPLSPGALQETLAALRAGPARDLPERPATAPDPVLPAPLARYTGGGLDRVAWRAAGRGVKQAILPMQDKRATARLLSIPAGAAMPDHGHRGTEITVVLQGAFADADGTFARGDVEVASAELDHMPVADISEDCICLAVTDAPLRFKDLLPRLAQPFLRI